MGDEGPRTVEIDREGAVARVTLARARVHDALDETSVAELTAAFTDLSADAAVRVVVLGSLGRSFCAGADLGWMARMAQATEAEGVADAERLAQAFAAIARCPKPVVARVQGAALGGGAGLVAACDIAIASTAARLAFTEVRIGIVPAVISPHVLRKIGRGAAQALFLTGETIPAQRALELGLLHRVVEPDQLDEAVRATVIMLLEGSTAAHASVKRLLDDVDGLPLEEAAPVTARAIAAARRTEDGREGMAAFLEKRPPSWSPRA